MKRWNLQNKSAGNGKHRDAKQSLAASLMCIVDLPESSKPSFLVILFDDLEYGNQVEKRHSLWGHYFNEYGKAKVAMRSGKWKFTRSAKMTHCGRFNFTTDISEPKDMSIRQPARIDSLSSQPVRPCKGTQQEAPVWQGWFSGHIFCTLLMLAMRSLEWWSGRFSKLPPNIRNIPDHTNHIDSLNLCIPWKGF